MRNVFLIISGVGLLLILGFSWLFNSYFLLLLAIWTPISAIGLYDMIQTDNVIKRNYPVVGRLRFLMEELRPKVHQYFVETDINGRPYNRLDRETVYARAKGSLDTHPFGTQLNTYEEGYEWMHHSIGALDSHKLNPHPRVRIGGKDCLQPYDASILNVSAMSYGSLSKNAVLAINGAAKLGHFAQNTGEGGISQYHLEKQGDLIYQIGTGYFGCRSKNGHFDESEFEKRALLPSVKMIEIKLSQGAKPGHGGILPAKKNNEEIATIRGVEAFTNVISPPYHSAFRNPIELMQFIALLREKSKGKPIGIKLCVGHRREVIALCKAMKEIQIMPDYIAVDGGEGGTGAAPLEFSNSVGRPLKEGLATVHDCLVGFDLRDQVKLIASGKITTGFDMYRAFALGADVCYAARAMMLAMGCIQALQCNSNKCPTGITTHKPSLTVGLVPEDKAVKVARYHAETIHSFVELLAASGLRNHHQIDRSFVHRRLSVYESKSLADIMPPVAKGALIDEANIPKEWRKDIFQSKASSFLPQGILQE